jgi:hypothetical protein
MPIRINISGNGHFYAWRDRSGEHDLDRVLNDFLQDRGEVTWDGDEHSGPGWFVMVLLYGDRDVDQWVAECARYLRRYGVPHGPIAFLVWR